MNSVDFWVSFIDSCTRSIHAHDVFLGCAELWRVLHICILKTTFGTLLKVSGVYILFSSDLLCV